MIKQEKTRLNVFSHFYSILFIYRVGRRVLLEIIGVEVLAYAIEQINHFTIRLSNSFIYLYYTQTHRYQLDMSRGLNTFQGRYLYRVLRPVENPKRNLKSVAPTSTRTIGEHVETGLSLPTKYISTTSSIICALKWMETYNEVYSKKYGKKRSIIVKIDAHLIKEKYPIVANSAIDLTNKKNQEMFLDSETQKWLVAAYKEILFENMIPSEAITVENEPLETELDSGESEILQNLLYIGKWTVGIAAPFIFGIFFL